MAASGLLALAVNGAVAVLIGSLNLSSAIGVVLHALRDRRRTLLTT